MEDTFSKNISELMEEILNIFNGFTVWKSLKKSEYNKLYNEYKYFWGIVIYSLQVEFLLGTAKLFEKRAKNDVFSIFYLLDSLPKSKEKEKVEEEINTFNRVIKNLIIWRHNMLAHHNIFFTLNPGELFKKFPIKEDEMENLVGLLEKILGMIHSAGTKKRQVYTFKLVNDESKSETENIIKKLIGK